MRGLRKCSKFYTAERGRLCHIGGKWLTDEHTHLAQSLLRAMQFPHINGLQCTLLSENDAQQHEALQIHSVAGNHWVASSSLGQQVTVFDSKYSGGGGGGPISRLHQPSAGRTSVQQGDQSLFASRHDS